ncbi:hypothetical protein GDO86_009151 [Hymenochirus boettgeri]|uniref:Uncharacterized protein n=1 Tax=Hymenochirus boettgeri TaxID=247094 RepID=A0A8T2JFC0_9PIPI|nr:hypothetical protein GDO86_009151 [Hymenochirus boettgeri]
MDEGQGTTATIWNTVCDLKRACQWGAMQPLLSSITTDGITIFGADNTNCNLRLLRLQLNNCQILGEIGTHLSTGGGLKSH